VFARVAPSPDHPFASFENRTAPWASACGAGASLPIDSSEFRCIVFLLQLADLLPLTTVLMMGRWIVKCDPENRLWNQSQPRSVGAYPTIGQWFLPKEAP
jgi:hypothetical protein